MPLTARPRFAPGDTIPSAWANILDDNFSLLDGRTGGDPGAAGKIPVASGTLGSNWLAAGGEGLPLRIASGTPAYGTLTDTVALGFKTVRAATPLLESYAAALAANSSGLYEVSPGNDGPFPGSPGYLLNIVETNQPTTYGFQLICEISNQNNVYMRLVVAGVAGSWVRMWHAGNDGSGSGLAADTAATAAAIADGAVSTTAKMANSIVTGANLTATAIEDNLGYAPGSVNSIHHAANSGMLTTTTSLQDIPGCSVTVGEAGTYKLEGEASFDANTGEGVGLIQLDAAGSPVGQVKRCGNGVGTGTIVYAGSVKHSMSLSAGATVKLRASKSAGAGNTTVISATVTAERISS